MSDLASELKTNYTTFRAGLRKGFKSADKALDADGSHFFDAYRRLATVNSWRADVLSAILPDTAVAFILEAQNDGLSSLAFATVGAWRTSLQALRNMIESTLMGLYFADHPVEHQLWLSGKYKIGFAALLEYFKAHPANELLPQNLDPFPAIRAEYDTLSKAVHGRAPFRMTKDAASTVTFDTSPILRNAYLTRQRETIRCLTLLKLMLFANHLERTKQQELRKLLTSVLPPAIRTAVRTRYNVILQP